MSRHKFGCIIFITGFVKKSEFLKADIFIPVDFDTHPVSPTDAPDPASVTGG